MPCLIYGSQSTGFSTLTGRDFRNGRMGWRDQKKAKIILLSGDGMKIINRISDGAFIAVIIIAIFAAVYGIMERLGLVRHQMKGITMFVKIDPPDDTFKLTNIVMLYPVMTFVDEYGERLQVAEDDGVYSAYEQDGDEYWIVGGKSEHVIDQLVKDLMACGGIIER